MKLLEVAPEFVDEIPRDLDLGTLYVCCRYRAVKHLCACGCGVEVNTPLHPTGWTLICDGVSVSLWPSIGNWSERCQSHYWIRNNRIHWAPKWSRRKVQKARRRRDSELNRYFSDTHSADTQRLLPERPGTPSLRVRVARFFEGLWRRR